VLQNACFSCDVFIFKAFCWPEICSSTIQFLLIFLNNFWFILTERLSHLVTFQGNLYLKFTIPSSPPPLQSLQLYCSLWYSIRIRRRVTQPCMSNCRSFAVKVRAKIQGPWPFCGRKLEAMRRTPPREKQNITAILQSAPGVKTSNWARQLRFWSKVITCWCACSSWSTCFWYIRVNVFALAAALGVGVLFLLLCAVGDFRWEIYSVIGVSMVLNMSAHVQKN